MKTVVFVLGLILMASATGYNGGYIDCNNDNECADNAQQSARAAASAAAQATASAAAAAAA